MSPRTLQNYMALVKKKLIWHYIFGDWKGKKELATVNKGNATYEAITSEHVYFEKNEHQYILLQ